MDEPTIKFHYLKSPAFRTIHVDGVHGGPSPTGSLNVAFFSERWAIPQEVTFVVKSDGTLGDEVPDTRVTRGGVTRELEAVLVMSPKMVKILHAWLGTQLEKLSLPVPSTKDEPS